MPPVVPRKRLRDSSPANNSKSLTASSPAKKAAGRRRPTLFDDLDATATPGSSVKTGGILNSLDGSDDEESSLSSLSDADFESFATRNRHKSSALVEGDDDDDGDEDDEDIEFEDVHAPQPRPSDAPMLSGDLELTLHRDTRISLTNVFGKKGPTKLERKIRLATHAIHVQLLLWHNHLRNAWLCDAEVQGIMLSHLPPRLWDDVDRWRRQSAIDKEPAAEPAQKGPERGKRNKHAGKGKSTDKAPSRDWSDAAERLEKGVVDMSHGDPLFRLLKALSSWWKLRFRVTAPGLRKLGYMSLERLDRLTKAFRAEEHTAERFGERITNLQEFREVALACCGSRDAGAQLFTALLRGLGLEVRMVASLQPLGFGWNKSEDADPEKEAKPASDADQTGQAPANSGSKSSTPARASPTTRPSASKTRVIPDQRSKDSRRRPIVVNDDDDAEDLELVTDESDGGSVIETFQSTSRKAVARSFDKDLSYPHYWTEVLSPVTNKYVVVEAVVKGTVSTNRELVESLEPRGAKADRAKQVMAYVVGFSADGSAKDVTVRYLKRQMLPGRTKGVRMPIEKVPIYNRHGKVKGYEPFDWFKSVMTGYVRGSKKCPITEVDEDEDATDLLPAKPQKKEVKEGEETLQYYKQSNEYVLQRHLRREEALLPTAGPVKVFRNKGKSSDAAEENVYLRRDVVQVKSAETWHKQGRAPMQGEEPLKRVPYRAATTNRRREIAAAEAASGEKVLQALYSFDQTDWIIPPPIRDGVIPKNEYGNIDLFVEHMCPEGAVHVPFRGATRVCKRLAIDFAEAVVDFEFGHRMAVPVIQGVVVVEEHYDRVMEEIAKDEAERARKEDEKKRKEMLGMWRKFLMGMRIVERIQQDYGDMKDNFETANHSHRHGPKGHDEPLEDVDMAGGFLPEGYEEEEHDNGSRRHETSSFFPVVDEGDDDVDDTLMVEHGDADGTLRPAATNQTTSLPGHTTKRRPTRGPSSSKRWSRRKAAIPSDNEDDDDYDGRMHDSDDGFKA